MRLFDTHTHLYLPEFDEDGGGEAAVRRAVAAGVEAMLMPNVDLTTIEPLRALQAQHGERVFAAMGLHPTEVGPSWRDDVAQALEALRPGDVAIGEVGMDLYWDRTFRDEQMLALEMQAQRAVELDLPLVIHCREALDETLEVLQGVRGCRGVMHSFGGTEKDVDDVRRALGDDWFFGINGIVTFKNCRVADALPAITVERLLLETDSPYLAPVPRRGKRNESAYIVSTAACVAAALGLPDELLAEKTFRNAVEFLRVNELF
ncbi:MAG: TatD family hydrolase [Muribaculaceae bacterium]|nr:TatD family hydrolase [Muribaculaceae bacterium]